MRAVVITAALLASMFVAATTSTAPAAVPCATILESPRAHSLEVQAKALNDRGDVVGFADSDNGSGPAHAILWKGGKAAGAVDLGVLPGYVSSEAYGVNDHRVVFGLLYDKRDRPYPFRWANGRMTVLKGPGGRLLPSDNPGSGGRNSINERGEMAFTLIVRGNRRAVRWAPDGRATFLPSLPGHTWTDVFGINDDGIVSGWSRKLPNEDGEENPVIWTGSGRVVPLATVAGRADGIAEAANHAGLIVGYLGTLGTEREPESDQAAVWTSRTAKPRLIGPVQANVITELVDVNDRGQAAGMTGPLNPKTGFMRPRPVIWRTGWTSVRALPIPAAVRVNPVLATALNDINNRGEIVGTIYGLSAPDYSKLRRIDPVLWTCRWGS